MLKFTKHILKNGLTILVHEDKTTSLACMNTLYKVGARNENPERTGMAHLFEHLMFTGSKNAENFDHILETAGGENNAFTNNDITNYYEILPAINIETAVFLEADRMKNLSLSDKSIRIQKSVVIEEFKERYLNQPYGNMDALIRKMAYKKHPYRWSTIGEKESHIADASKEELQNFYKTYYTPNNAIIAITGNIDSNHVLKLMESYFGDIAPSELSLTEFPHEDKQLETRIVEHYADVPQDALSLNIHMTDRLHSDYYAIDLISDILSNGKSSRLYSQLVKGKKIFTELDAWIDGSIDAGLLHIQGHPHSKYTLKDAENALLETLDNLKHNLPDDYECTKVINKAVSSWMFGNISIGNKAFNLAQFEMLGNANLINEESKKYMQVTRQQISQNIHQLFNPAQYSILRYFAQ